MKQKKFTEVQFIYRFSSVEILKSMTFIFFIKMNVFFDCLLNHFCIKKNLNLCFILKLLNWQKIKKLN